MQVLQADYNIEDGILTFRNGEQVEVSTVIQMIGKSGVKQAAKALSAALGVPEEITLKAVNEVKGESWIIKAVSALIVLCGGGYLIFRKVKKNAPAGC